MAQNAGYRITQMGDVFGFYFTMKRFPKQKRRQLSPALVQFIPYDFT